MKNKIVELRNGKTTCRILDTVISNGNSFYVALDFATKHIMLVNPREIWNIVEKDKNGEYVSVKDVLVNSGL